MKRIIQMLLSILESGLAIFGIVLIIWLIHYVVENILPLL